MTSTRADFVSGATAIFPLLFGVFPFGLIAGVAMATVGMSTAQAIGMSAIVFAGASQLAAAELIGRDAPLTLIVAVALVVNLRLMMYSASLAPYFRDVATRTRLVVGSFLTDMNYAVTITTFEDENEESVDHRWYYLGASIPLWLLWMAGTTIGVVVGARVPPEWQLEFAVPLIFIALATDAIDGRATAVAAVVAGVLAVGGTLLPLDLGLLFAAAGGIVAGMLVDRRDA